VELLIGERVLAPTTLAAVTLDAAGRAQYQFYSQGTADNAFTREGLIAALPERIEAFQIGGFCAIEAGDAEIWHEIAAEAARRGALIAIDPNLRPSLVKDLVAYRERVRALMGIAHLIKLSDDDLALLEPEVPTEAAAERLLGGSVCRMVVVSRGNAGVVAFTQAGRVELPAYVPAVFVDSVGAGDTLMGALLARLMAQGLLTEAGLSSPDPVAIAEALRFAIVAAGLNCARAGCQPPALDAVEAALRSA
jgi:fructokinase